MQENQLVVKTWKTKYEINNPQVVECLLNKFSELTVSPVLVDEKEMMKQQEDNRLNDICRKIYQFVISNESLSGQKAEKYMLEDIVDFSGIRQKDTLIKCVEEMPEGYFRVIIPAERGCIVVNGDKDDISTVVQKMVCKEFEEIDSVLLRYAKEKSKELQKVEDKNLICYFSVTDDSVGIQERYVFRNIALCEEEWIDLQEIELNDSESINMELSQLKNLFQKMSSDIEGYGFQAYHQIPFKVCEFQYRSLNDRKKCIAAGVEPGEVYVRAIKEGVEDLLSFYTEEHGTHWVMAQTKLDVMINAVLPLIFEHISELDSEKILQETMDLSQYKHVVLDLLDQTELAFNLPKLEVKIYSIKGTNLMKCVLSQAGKQNFVIEGYGIEKNQILDSLWVNYYAVMIQNSQEADEEHQECMRIRIGNDSNLHGKEEQEKYNQIKGEIDKVILKEGNVRIKVQRWKYNHYLKKVKMECLKVKIL